MIDDQARRTSRWLRAYAQTPVDKSALTRRYLRYIESWDRPLSLDDPGLEADKQPQAYEISRSGAANLGRKAFLYRTPGSKRHHDAGLLQEILRGLTIFHDRLDDKGRFIFGRGDYYNLGCHEAVWRLEPIIWARLWLADDLAAKDKRWIDDMIRRASQYLLDQPRLDLSNQGIIWCYGCWLSGLYLNESRYIDAGEQYAEVILRAMIDAKGQVKEAADRYFRGGGPCSNYTYTGWTYVMLYRLLSGRADLDDLLLSALRWSAHYVTQTGLPRAAAASVRIYRPRVAVADMLHGYAFYAHREPAFQSIIQRLLPECEAVPRGHALHPAIWTANATQPVKAPKADPAWLADFEQDYDNPPTQYALITHRYQTGVTMRGLFPANGLQTFAYGHEPSIIHPTDKIASTIRCKEVDIALQNVDAGPRGWETHLRRKHPHTLGENAARLSSIATRRKHVWECYLFTEASVIYLVGSTDAQAPLHGQWVLHESEHAPASIDRGKNRVNFKGRQAKIHYLHGTPKLTAAKDQAVFKLDVRRGPLVIGFGSDDLRLEHLDRRKQTLRFTDATGSYLMGYRSILSDDGLSLRRWWGNIVQHV